MSWSDAQAITASLLGSANRIDSPPSGNSSYNWWTYKYPSSISFPLSSYKGCGLTWKTDCRRLAFAVYLRIGRVLLQRLRSQDRR